MDTPDGTDRSPRLPARPLTLIAVLVVALVVIAAVVLTGHGHRHGAAGPTGAPGPGAAGHPAHPAHPAAFRSGGADLLVLDGVSGRVRVAADTDAHGVSGTFARGDGAPARISARTSRGTGGSTVTVTCADGTGAAVPCAGDLAVTVPGATGVELRQTSGETTLTGIGGRLDLTVASDRLTAGGLHPRQAAVAITSGSADLGFTGAPDRLDVNAASASVALHVPPAGGYAVTSAATSADVRVDVPRHDGAPRAIALRVASGSLAVLPT